MKLSTLVVFLAAAASAQANIIDLPKITLHETRSWNEIPSIDIEFPDGHIDTLILQRFYSSEEERRSQELNCNFFGRLANSPGACVTVTGCPGREDLELTINSKHSGPSNMYILRENGELEVVESLFKDPSMLRGEYELPDMALRDKEIEEKLVDGDEMINPGQVAQEMKIEEECDGKCPMPATNLLKLKIGHDDSWYNSFPSFLGEQGIKAASDDYINKMLAHLQAYFCLESLGTKVQLERVGEITHHKGHNWYAQDKPVHHLSGSIRDIYRATKDDSGAHLHVYMCKDTTPTYYEGVMGRAYVGSLCVPWKDGTSINEKQWSITSTSEIVAHELGHNLGMLHDHAEEHGGKGNPECDKKGFMSYGHHEFGWSACSKADFQAQHEFRHAPSYGIHWCLPEAPTACGLEPPPPSTTNPPATTTETATTSAPAPFVFTNCVVDWCLQANTKDQYTKCWALDDNDTTCIHPTIRYGNLTGGVPTKHPKNNYDEWCQQLSGDTNLIGSVTTVSEGGWKLKLEPWQGTLFWSSGYDESGPHWCDRNDGYWYNDKLDATHGDPIWTLTCKTLEP